MVRSAFFGICIFLCFLLAACAPATQNPEPTETVYTQDIILSPDAEEESVLPQVETEKTKEELEKELTDYIAELESKIREQQDKIQSLYALKSSYQAENPSDLEEKLARCDALIAQAEAELSSLQERLEQNKLALSSLTRPDEPLPDDLPPEGFLPDAR